MQGLRLDGFRLTSWTMMKSIAIVGAGIAGAVCASQLATLGHAVIVFDKGRGPGGRMSSRRTDSGHRFDHGASRIDVTQPALHELFAPAVVAGLLRRVDDTYTSPSGMNAIGKWLLDGQAARYATKIIRLERAASWHAFDETGLSHGPYDAVVLAIPPVNAGELVIGQNTELARTIASVRMLPRWVAVLAFSEKLKHVPDKSIVTGQIVRRSTSNAIGDAMVIEASQHWSIQHLEVDANAVGNLLTELCLPVLGSATPISIAAHRWRYAFADKPLGRPFLTDQHGLFVCGDWCLGHSIESAWLSAVAVVGSIGRA